MATADSCIVSRSEAGDGQPAVLQSRLAELTSQATNLGDRQRSGAIRALRMVSSRGWSTRWIEMPDAQRRFRNGTSVAIDASSEITSSISRSTTTRSRTIVEALLSLRMRTADPGNQRGGRLNCHSPDATRKLIIDGKEIEADDEHHAAAGVRAGGRRNSALLLSRAPVGRRQLPHVPGGMGRRAQAAGVLRAAGEGHLPQQGRHAGQDQHALAYARRRRAKA